MASLEPFFRPRGVAFIGATEDPSKLGGRRYRSLVEDGYAGAIYPVHPTATSLRGLRVYRSVRDVPDPVDLAIIVVPTRAAPATVADCAARGVPAVLMVTAGFGEVDEAGRQIEHEMVQTLADAGARMLGPNASGLFAAENNLNVGGSEVPRGSIGLISQSGNLLLDFNQYAKERGLGFSRQATLGNAADLGVVDLIADYLDDPGTRVILTYLEGWNEHEGRALFDLVRSHANSKPIVFLKPGRSEVGRRAVHSHTGALAGEEPVVDAALRQCGIVRARNIEETWELAAALGHVNLPSGDRVAVISDGGGHSSVLCDALGQAGLCVPVFSEVTQSALSAFLPARAAIANPVDFAGVAETDPSVIAQTSRICLADADVDAVIVTGHFGGYHKIGGDSLQAAELDTARGLSRLEQHGKPVLMHSIYANENLAAHCVLRESGIPVLRSPESAAAMVAGLRQAERAGARRKTNIDRLSTPDRRAVQQLCAKRSASGDSNVLLEPEARELMAVYGIPVPRYRVVDCATACADEVDANGPSALKVISEWALHRTDVGGVHLNVNRREDAMKSFTALLETLPAEHQPDARVLVTPMITDGFEFVIGAFRDIQFGPMVMFGTGGVTLEAVADVTFRVAPLAVGEAHEMLDEIRARSLLDGFRGARPGHRDAAGQILVRLGEMLVDLPEVAEIDLNPVFIDAAGAHLADARVIFGRV